MSQLPSVFNAKGKKPKRNVAGGNKRIVPKKKVVQKQGPASARSSLSSNKKFPTPPTSPSPITFSKDAEKSEENGAAFSPTVSHKQLQPYQPNKPLQHSPNKQHKRIQSQVFQMDASIGNKSEMAEMGRSMPRHLQTRPSIHSRTMLTSTSKFTSNHEGGRNSISGSNGHDHGPVQNTRASLRSAPRGSKVFRSSLKNSALNQTMSQTVALKGTSTAENLAETQKRCCAVGCEQFRTQRGLCAEHLRLQKQGRGPRLRHTSSVLNRLLTEQISEDDKRTNLASMRMGGFRVNAASIKIEDAASEAKKKEITTRLQQNSERKWKRDRKNSYKLDVPSMLSTNQQAPSEGELHSIILPKTLMELLDYRNANATTVEGGASAFLSALLSWSENTLPRAEKWQALAATVHQSQTVLAQSVYAYDGRELCDLDRGKALENLSDCPHVIRSYIDGATPANGYTLPQEGEFKAKFMILERSTTKGALIMVYSSGSKYPRSIKLQLEKVSGLWKCNHWFNLLRMI